MHILTCIYMLICAISSNQIETENYLFSEKICLKRKTTMQRIISTGHNAHLRWKHSRHSPTIWYVYLWITLHILHHATEAFNALVWRQSSHCQLKSFQYKTIKRAQLLRFYVNHTKANSTVSPTLTRRPPFHVLIPYVFLLSADWMFNYTCSDCMLPEFM